MNGKFTLRDLASNFLIKTNAGYFCTYCFFLFFVFLIEYDHLKLLVDKSIGKNKSPFKLNQTITLDVLIKVGQWPI